MMTATISRLCLGALLGAIYAPAVVDPVTTDARPGSGIAMIESMAPVKTSATLLDRQTFEAGDAAAYRLSATTVLLEIGDRATGRHYILPVSIRGDAHAAASRESSVALRAMLRMPDDSGVWAFSFRNAFLGLLTRDPRGEWRYFAVAATDGPASHPSVDRASPP